jgi:hypothetical protein
MTNHRNSDLSEGVREATPEEIRAHQPGIQAMQKLMASGAEIAKERGEPLPMRTARFQKPDGTIEVRPIQNAISGPGVPGEIATAHGEPDLAADISACDDMAKYSMYSGASRDTWKRLTNFLRELSSARARLEEVEAECGRRLSEIVSLNGSMQVMRAQLAKLTKRRDSWKARTHFFMRKAGEDRTARSYAEANQRGAEERLQQSEQREARMRAALHECEAYLSDREDVVDGDYGEPAPNKEMTLLQEVRAALSPAESMSAGKGEKEREA